VGMHLTWIELAGGATVTVSIIVVSVAIAFSRRSAQPVSEPPEDPVPKGARPPRTTCPRCRSELLKMTKASGFERLRVLFTGERRYRCTKCEHCFRAPDRRSIARELGAHAIWVTRK
jgi:hypothetical protein